MERWDIRGANEALKNAGAKATTICRDLPEAPAHDALLADLIRNVQDHMDRPGRASPLVELPEKLREVCRRFDRVARKDAGEITADGAGVLPR